MKASDMLRNNNGLKTTQSVLNKQQSGVDAAQKASPEQMNMNTAQDMLQGKGEQLTPPKDAHEQAARMNQQTAEGMLNGSIPTDKPSVPIVKKDEQKPQPKQLSYADMYKMLNPERVETAEQKANREKKERTKARIAALGDGLRALSNIYFATKGAKVVHNSESDMTKVVNKRKEYMDAQREKNRAAWLAGYQRAMALDEEARKNDLTLAEQMRYHDMQNENNKTKNDINKTKNDQTLAEQIRYHDMINESNKTKNDQGQQRIDQGNRRLDGQIRHWNTQDALARQRERRIANKAQKSSGGNQTTIGYWYKYYDLMGTPDGQKKINELKRKLRIKNVTQTNVRYIIDRLEGRSSSAGGGTSSGGGKHTTHKAGGSSSANGRTLHGIK